MTEFQQTNVIKTRSYADRVVGLLVFLMITGGFALLWGAEKGYLKPQYLIGVCGFKQRYNLPCPGCGWTHSAQAFVTGDIKRSFQEQPAAGVACFVLGIVWILALHTVVFGIHSKLRQALQNPRFWKHLLIGSVIVFLAGWLVMLAKAVSKQG